MDSEFILLEERQMMNANRALQSKMMAHVEAEFAANGKEATGEIMQGYLDIFDDCGDVNAFEWLLDKITADAEA
jgi:hypothetical protein